jgi:UDP-N-acetylmuramate--alanine ligase
MHNLRNALAALAVAVLEELPLAPTLDALHSYQGVDRRFEVKGQVKGVTVIDDYAHHPTEVRATLAAARARYPGRTLWAVFQPHTFSRTAAMLPQMAASFGDADQVIVTDIFPSREQDTGLVHSRDLVAASVHPAIQHIPKLEAVADYLGQRTHPGDIVVILGAGTSYQIGEMLIGEQGPGTGDRGSGGPLPGCIETAAP